MRSSDKGVITTLQCAWRITPLRNTECFQHTHTQKSSLGRRGKFVWMFGFVMSCFLVLDSSPTACSRPAPEWITPLCRRLLLFSLCQPKQTQSQAHLTLHWQQSTDQCLLGTQAIFTTTYVWVSGTGFVVTCTASTFSQPNNKSAGRSDRQTDAMTSQEVRSKIRRKKPNILLSHRPDAALTILFIRAACVCDARSGVCVCVRLPCRDACTRAQCVFTFPRWFKAVILPTNAAWCVPLSHNQTNGGCCGMNARH